jgi:hypothetical protein
MATLISALSNLTGSINNNTNVFPVLDQTISSSANRNKKARITTHNLFYSNNTTVASLSSYDNYFGTGTDGDCTISSSAQVSSSTSPAGLNNTLYGDLIIKNFKSLTIDNGVLFSPLRACRGMVIYCTGNLTVNGTISMTGKGGGVATKIASPIGIASSTDSRYDLVDATLYFNNFSSSAAGIIGHMNWAPSGSAWFSNYKIRVPLSGSVAGGVAGSGAGGAGIFSCGGGGAGGNSPYSPGWIGGNGGRGTIFSGGGGGSGGGDGGGFPTSTTVFEVGATAYGGAGGGAGSPLGVYTPSWAPTVAGTAGGDGVGGLLLLIVRGNITINGTVSNNGRNGGNGGLTNNAVQCGGGGGSGGGRTIIIYGGTYTNAGSVVVNGGSGGSGYGAGGSGGSGGAGSTTVKKVHV